MMNFLNSRARFLVLSVLFLSHTGFPFILRDVMEPIQTLSSMESSALIPSLSNKKVALRSWLRNQSVTCPEIAPGDDVASVCPWQEIEETDNSRRPATITKAVCQCSGCLSIANGTRSNEHGICQEVVRPMKVLRKVHTVNATTEGEHEFMLDIELVPVACTCKGVDPINMNRRTL